MRMKIFRQPQSKVSMVLLALAIILIGRLFYLTVITGQQWKKSANNLSIKGIYTASPRGSILDRNGKVLATNRQIFTVKMRAGDLDNEALNEASTKLIEILDKNEEKYELDFPIGLEDGKFYFTFEQDIKKWLNENEFPLNYSAEEAFYALKDRLGIDAKDRYEIQKQMHERKNVYPPISVKEMKFSAELEKKQFLKSYDIKEENISASKTIDTLVEHFQVDKNLSDEEKLKILSIRNQLNTVGYQRYMTTTIAKNVSSQTVVDVEELSNTVNVVEISSESKRYYPNGKLASHIIGYMGKISAEERAKYEESGYDSEELVGKQGIEERYEKVLRGQAGTEVIKVNARGGFAGKVKSIPAEKGKDVFLTIDSDLQATAEDSLKRNIEACQSGSLFESKYGNIKIEHAPKAKTGAVVAMEVETGEVLAMASYPDYDPNLFADGISSEDWKSLQSTNPRDSLAPAPLLNLATMTAVQPGSTFKPVTALAALESGLNPKRTLKDDGFIKLGDRTFGCYLWNTSRGTHGYQDLNKAMKFSCNHYFYDIVSNKDWHTGKSLNLEGMDVNKVISTAKRLGLGELTGIELSEVNAGYPNEKRKLQNLKAALRNALYAKAEDLFEKEVYINQKRLKKDIETIVSWLDDKELTYNKLNNEYLLEVGVKASKYHNLIEIVLFEFYNQVNWGQGDAFNISIGQGDNAYTPIQVARYLCTLGSYGKKKEATIVKNIEEEGDRKRKAPTDVKMSKKDAEAVIEAMHHVVSGGETSLSYQYEKFPWKVAAKTGTAQKAGYINPVSEVEYVKRYLSSFGTMSWAEVEAEMKRLMKEYPNTYSSEDVAVRKAVINLSKGKTTYDNIDQFKDVYDEFAWLVVLAPKDNPKIAVACMIPQGVSGASANGVVRDIIGQYLEGTKAPYKDILNVEGIN